MTFGTKKTIIDVEADALDAFAQATYGRNPDVAEEWSRGTHHRIMVDGDLDAMDDGDMAEWKATGRACAGIAQLILNDMARNGFIEQAEYMVFVD